MAVVLSPEEFMADFKREAQHATRRIVSQVMSIDAGPVGEEVLEAFARADARVHKELYLDWYTHMVSDRSILAFHRLAPWSTHAKRMQRKKEALLARLEKAGVIVYFTNPPKNPLVRFFPYVGRLHLKGTTIDDRIFYLGGRNFDNSGWIDFMVKFTDDMAAKIARAFDAVHRGAVVVDTYLRLSDHEDLYIDTGIGTSLILDTAVEMINNARKTVMLTSMLPPDGPIARALMAAAERGVQIEIKTGSKRLSHGFVVDIVRAMTRLRCPLVHTQILVHELADNGMHAKLLITDEGTPHQEAYFGSHNLSYAGVRAHTQEWGIVTTHADLVRDLVEYYRRVM